MPPATVATALRSAYNLTSLLQVLPSSSLSPQLFTRCSACQFSTTAQQLSISKKRNKKRTTDPYRAAQAKQRKAANIARQATLQEQRRAAMGDPVRSQPTPFIQSLSDPSSYSPSEGTPAPTASQQHLNYFLKPSDVTKQLSYSKWLTEPIPLSSQYEAFNQKQSSRDMEDPETEKLRRDAYLAYHANAETAIHNITDLGQGSSKDKTRINVQRCIEEFGRHSTDSFLPPKPASAGTSLSNLDDHKLHPLGPQLSEEEANAAAELAALPKRVGPDTGSSEVQVAILTTKINVLVDSVGKKDKHNKRNLRLLVHRRQKLLSYLRRKERGGPRWQHLVEKLGINDAMWKGEISL